MFVVFLFTSVSTLQVEEVVLGGAELSAGQGVGQVTFDMPENAFSFKVDAR